MTDDERRDLETHIKEHFRLSLAIQVKASYVLYGLGRAPRFQKSFVVRPERLIEDAFFWYFFGFMDLETMAYRAPVFLVPSHVVHKEAVHELRGGLIHYNFEASMNQSSRDRWRPYACEPAQIAGRVVKVLRSQPSRRLAAMHQSAMTLVAEPGTIVVGRPA